MYWRKKKKRHERGSVDAHSQGAKEAYERLRQHAMHPGSVRGIDSLVVLVQRGLAAWLAVVQLAADRSTRPGPSAAMQSSSARGDRAMIDVFVAMLKPHVSEFIR